LPREEWGPRLAAALALIYMAKLLPVATDAVSIPISSTPGPEMTVQARGAMGDWQIRRARPDEAEALSELAVVSKGSWGYPGEFLAACRQELSLSPETIASTPVFVAEVGEGVVGFYSLQGAPPEGELGHLFVDPGWTGKGYGRRLWDHAIATARGIGFTSLLIESDPFAEAFYRAVGAQRIGKRESGSIPGRMLPLLRIELSPQRLTDESSSGREGREAPVPKPEAEALRQG